MRRQKRPLLIEARSGDRRTAIVWRAPSGSTIPSGNAPSAISDRSPARRGPIEVAIFKVMFDRTRDWAGLEGMAGRGTLDYAAVRASLRALRLARLAEVER